MLNRRTRRPVCYATITPVSARKDNNMPKDLPAPVCEGQVAEGRRCRRRTRSPDGLCGVCKGRKNKQAKKAARRQKRAAAAKTLRESDEPASTFLLVGHNYSTVIEQIYRASDSDIDETLKAMESSMDNSSAYTGAEFVGINRLYLAGRSHQKGHKSNRWATDGQWRELGGRVPKDAEGARIMLNRTVDGHVYMTFATVYNEDEVVFRKRRPHADTTNTGTGRGDRRGGNGHYGRLAGLVETKLGVSLKTGMESPERPGVFYPTGHNTITLDDPELSRSEHERTLQLLHEVMHWTRERRSVLTHDETEEELTAILATALAASRIGVPFEGDPGRGHAKHLVGVLDKLQPEALMKASSLASQSVKYVTTKGVLPPPFEGRSETTDAEPS